MNPLSRAALSLALIFPVFALINLSGQPGSFIPPLYADHFLLVIFCVVVLLKKKSGLNLLLFIPAILSIILNGLTEINNAVGFWNINLPNQVILTSLSIILITFSSLLFLIRGEKNNVAFPAKISWSTYCLVQTLVFYQLIDFETPLFYLYILSGLFAFAGVLIIKDKSSLKGYLLLIVLLVYFDLFTYFSLYFL